MAPGLRLEPAVAEGLEDARLEWNLEGKRLGDSRSRRSNRSVSIGIAWWPT